MNPSFSNSITAACLRVILHSSRRVTVELDDKAFRYYNVKTKRFEIESGEYEILVGASSADIRLSQTIKVEGTGAPLPYAPESLKDYYTGSVKAIPDDEFRALLGHEIPDGSWSGTLGMNDALCQMYYAKSRGARLVWSILTKLMKQSEKKGVPNLDILFVYNMPFRGMAKVTGGLVTMEMAEGILTMVNGHFLKGAGKAAGGLVRSIGKRKKAKTMR